MFDTYSNNAYYSGKHDISEALSWLFSMHCVSGISPRLVQGYLCYPHLSLQQLEIKEGK